MQKIFISHDSSDAILACAVETLIGEITGGTVSIQNSSSKEVDAKIPLGHDWLVWVQEQVSTSDVTLVLLTQKSVRNLWVSWESGAVWGAAAAAGRINTILPLYADISADNIPAQLRNIQAADISTEEGIKEALLQIVGRGLQDNKTQQHKSLIRIGEKKGFSNYFNAYKEYEDKVKNSSNSIASLRRILESMEFHQSPIWKMPTIALAYSQYLERVIERIKSWPNRPLVVPSIEYPHYLIRLQEQLSISVSAVAIVDDVEKFWARKMGHQILDGSALGRTRRVFVIRDEADLRDYETFLSQHSKKYDVRLLSLKSLKAKYADYARDFSILSTTDTDHVLARYINERHDTGIEFTTDRADVKLHMDAFERIWKKAIPFADHPRIDMLVNAIFSAPRLEMSRYIKIKDYHLHEEKHAYFVEMMEKMIEISQRFRNSEFTKILEMGAGTGHLTKRIVRAFSSTGRITAMEYDTECYTFLLQNGEVTSHLSNCELLNENSREYDPPGKFDLILSSFADHHIIRSEVEADKYFEMVKHNLHSGASYIIGDEFIPEHDTKNSQSRENAIKSYHGHIIEVARAMQEKACDSDKRGYEILIELETKAMISGLNEEGDFKISLSHYLQRLTRNGLRFDTPELIGPTDNTLRDRVGGIYVIRAYL